MRPGIGIARCTDWRSCLGAITAEVGHALPDQRRQRHGRSEEQESQQGIDGDSVLDGAGGSQHTHLERPQGRARTSVTCCTPGVCPAAWVMVSITSGSTPSRRRVKTVFPDCQTMTALDTDTPRTGGAKHDAPSGRTWPSTAVLIVSLHSYALSSSRMSQHPCVRPVLPASQRCALRGARSAPGRGVPRACGVAGPMHRCKQPSTI
jgi:hypothetical protein